MCVCVWVGGGVVVVVVVVGFEPISSPFGTPTVGDVTIPRNMTETEKPRCHISIVNKL